MRLKEAIEARFALLAAKTSVVTGSFWAFAGALLVILVIQHAQDKEMRAVQLKLNEIIAAVDGASNRLIDIEDLSEHELEHLYARYQHLAATSAKLAAGARTTVEEDQEKEKEKDEEKDEA